jgi:F0F1-type ATP synthase delta subunit
MSQRVSRRAIAKVIAEKLLAEPARRDHWMKALASFLVENHMADDADLVSNDIAHELFVQGGPLLVEVTSARPLNESVRAELVSFLKKQTDAKEVVIAARTDTSLLGGVIARTPSQELDASVRAQLKQLAAIQ